MGGVCVPRWRIGQLAVFAYSVQHTTAKFTVGWKRTSVCHYVVCVFEHHLLHAAVLSCCCVVTRLCCLCLHNRSTTARTTMAPTTTLWCGPLTLCLTPMSTQQTTWRARSVRSFPSAPQTQKSAQQRCGSCWRKTCLAATASDWQRQQVMRRWLLLYNTL